MVTEEHVLKAIEILSEFSLSDHALIRRIAVALAEAERRGGDTGA